MEASSSLRQIFPIWQFRQGQTTSPSLALRDQ